MKQVVHLAAIVICLCACASDGKDGSDGRDGRDGDDGANGLDGMDGESVEIEMLDVGDSDCPHGGTAFTVDGDTTFACNGERGPTGDAGPPGDYQPVTSVLCSRTPDLINGDAPSPSDPSVAGPDGVQETLLTYNVTIYSNGDVFVECEGALGSAESVGATDYFPAVTQGAAARTCTYALDYLPSYPAPANVGFWAYKIDATGPVVAYSDDDAGHPRDGYTYRFTDDDCHVRRINGEGEWADITIADL